MAKRKTQKECVLEEDGCAQARAHGYLVRKMQYIGIRGCPDRWFFKPGRIVALELKKLGEKPGGQQQKQIDTLSEYGVEVHVVDNMEDFCRILEIPIPDKYL